jgi:hypothetical protein
MRNLKYDKESEKYILLVEEETKLMSGKKEVGTQQTKIKQIWDKDQLPVILEQITAQEQQAIKNLNSLKAKLKEIGLIKTRERQVLKEFLAKFEKAQKIQQIEQIEQQIKDVQIAIDKITKDKKELQDAIK